ncbi:sodium/hydrogen antiporter [gamma proteobacterium HTCC5015]|nr:sodium/hydrogen antiporter [gamma proteobacterium HTCC5015]
MHQDIVFSIFIIFAGAAVFATLALAVRQSLLVAYMVLGFLVGPYALGWASDIQTIENISHIGIIFLLFLLGLNLELRGLLVMMRSATIVTLLSAISFALVGTALANAFGFRWIDSLLIGLCCIFSSTIIGLKLLPTTALHHQHMGEIIVSVLLLQDVLAIIALIVIQGSAQGEAAQGMALLKLALSLPALVLVAFVASRYILQNLLARFDRIQEYIFLLTVAWCLTMAELANYWGLSYEIGAFVGGVSLAISPIARYIAEHLKPLRDFFLVMFFFSLGAQFNPTMFAEVALPAGLLAVLLMLFKPWVFAKLLKRQGERQEIAVQAGTRLGQVSEFSLLIAVIAVQAGVMSDSASYVVQLSTLITFVVSSYWIVHKYPTPVSTNERLRMD